MLMGTSWSLSLRRWAVTMISPSSPVSAGESANAGNTASTLKNPAAATILGGTDFLPVPPMVPLAFSLILASEVIPHPFAY
jgi:hypothetical protein